MKSILGNAKSWRQISMCALACAYVSATVLSSAQQPAAKTVPRTPAASSAGAKLFDTPQQATDALVNAAEKFDVAALTEIFGPAGDDVVFSGEFGRDRKRAADFSAEAREKTKVSVDPKNRNRAFVLVGNEDLAFPRAASKKWREMVLRQQGRPAGNVVSSHRRERAGCNRNLPRIRGCAG